jgi:6-phosphogluconate dehydrogenase
LKDERAIAESVYGTATKLSLNADTVRDALRASNIIAYAQGFAQLTAASTEYGYKIKMDLVAKIWRAGCIIRSVFLQSIMDAYGRDATLPNLLLDPHVAEQLKSLQGALREVVCEAQKAGIPVPALSASLNYFDSYRSGRLPANVIQGQRDFFGSHTYERLDKPGSFHTEWEAE